MATTDPETAGYLPFARPSITEREKRPSSRSWIPAGSPPVRGRSCSRSGSPRPWEHGTPSRLNSATAALHLALDALGVGPEDEVIVPTWTFAASAEVVVYPGARPILVDVDRSHPQRDAGGRPRGRHAADQGSRGGPHRRHAGGDRATRRARSSPRHRGGRGRGPCVSEPDRRAGRPPRRDDRAGRRVLVLRNEDDHDRRGRHARHRRRRDRGSGRG